MKILVQKISDTFALERKWVKAFLILIFSIVTIISIYNNTLVQMIKLWSISDTYAHGFIVPFISLWLIWRNRHIWMYLNPQPSPKTLFLIFFVSIFWFAGNLVAVNAVTQLSFVMMIALCIPVVVGWKIASLITFPIAFLFFSVPIGDFMLPTMMDWTADFTVIALQLTGIPVYREGLQFVIPSGRWSVVEACSGIRYLLASLTVGSLFAYLNYQSFVKRSIFIVFAIVVPLIANWLRAYMIVLIGHYSGNELATGVDHLIYGWLFFGLIILVMLFIGMKWADLESNIINKVEINREINGEIKISNAFSDKHKYVYLCLFLIAVAPHIFNKLISSTVRELPVHMHEMAAADSWKVNDNILNKWQPSFPHSVSQYNKNYINVEGEEVGLHISYYRQQNYERKLVTSTNDLINGSDDWVKTSHNNIKIDLNEESFLVEINTLRYKKFSQEKKNFGVQAWKFYWVNEKLTANNIYAKILGALSKIKGQGDDGAIIVIYVPFSYSESYVEYSDIANNIIKSFLVVHEKNIKMALFKTKNDIKN